MRTNSAWRILACSLFIATLNSIWAQPLTVTTIAGLFDHNGYVNGVGTNAQFQGLNDFSDLAADANGFLYVVDGNSIRRISPDFLVVTLAGNPAQTGYVDATGTNALFSSPAGIAADANGNVYVADQGNYVIRKITFAGVVSTVAGDGTYGYVDSAAGTPEFQGPNSVALDSAGNIYVADYTTLRMITPAGVVSTLAGTQSPGFDDGTGTSAQFISPFFLAAKVDASIHVAMAWVIRNVTLDGTVSTLAGGSHTDTDGLTTNAGFDQAYSIALDNAGGLYVADYGAGTIRYVTSAGVVTTVAGTINRFPYPHSNDGVGTNAWFSGPQGIAVDPFGNVYVVDGGEYTVLKGVPPALPPIGSFSESPGGTPVRSNNPWQFTAYYTTLVSDLRLHVQSTTTTNDESSWSDLPGNPNMTHVGANWTLNTTDVPAGTQYFRVVASAPGYSDTPSAVEGPETVLAGISPFGTFSWQTITPYRSGASWTFNIVETSVISGLSLRVQSSADGTNWYDLSDGQMSTSDSVNWTVTSFAVPTGTLSFRVVASASTYPDQISQPSGQFTIVAGLPATGSFLVSTGGSPIRSSNPWEFLAVYTNFAGLQLRVQSTETTNDNGSWEDLPENPYMTNDLGAWILNCTDVPVGVQYFRVVASASGYLDGFSSISEPQTVLEGFDLWGYFSYATTVPFWTATPWSFAIVQPADVPGMSVRLQYSQAEYPGIWTDMPGGAQMTLFSDGQTWLLNTTNLPTGLITFQAVASAPNYVDLASGPLGPFPIVTPLAASSTALTQGGTESLQDVGSDFASAFNHVINAIGAEVNLILNGNASTQGAVTLSGSQGGSVGLTIANGQVLTASHVNVGTSANLIINGTVNANLNVGLITQDGGSLITQDGGSLITQDGGSLIAQDGGSIIGLNGSGIIGLNGSGLVAQNISSLNKIVAASLQQNTSSPMLSVSGSEVISQNTSAVISQNTSAVVAGSLTSSNLSRTPLWPRPNAPRPDDPPPTQPVFTGIMTVNGDYTQLNGALVIAIAGTNNASNGAQQYDQMVVNGNAKFSGGCIAFGLFDPNDQSDQTNVFQPVDGAIFDVLVASNIVVQGLSVRGPLWGDGQFFSSSVVTRPDGLQALRLVAYEVPPILFLRSAGPALRLAYATNYTGYDLQSTPDLSSGNWTTLSTGTNVVMVNPTNAGQFFQLFRP